MNERLDLAQQIRNNDAMNQAHLNNRLRKTSYSEPGYDTPDEPVGTSLGFFRLRCLIAIMCFISLISLDQYIGRKENDKMVSVMNYMNRNPKIEDAVEQVTYENAKEFMVKIQKILKKQGIFQ